jgi:hypothetical protein
MIYFENLYTNGWDFFVPFIEKDGWLYGLEFPENKFKIRESKGFRKNYQVCATDRYVPERVLEMFQDPFIEIIFLKEYQKISG